MKTRKLGTSGLDVSPLCLGTMTFGEADASSMMHQVGCDEPTAHAILDRALEAGVSFLDTADVYGQDGLSERVIGRWFAARGQRDRVVLATKFRFTMPYGKGAGRRHILRACEESLRRLQTDRIDLYQVHMQDRTVPAEETLRALDDLVRQGKVLHIGLSNYSAARMVDSLWTSRSLGLERFVSAQLHYNLVERSVEREHLPACAAWGLGVIPWSPLAGGFLTGKLRRDEAPPAGSRLDRWAERRRGFDTPRHWAVLDALLAVAAELEAPPAAVALAWLLHQSTVASAIFGARSLAQLEDNLRAATLELRPDQLQRLGDAGRPDYGYPYDFIARVQGSW